MDIKKAHEVVSLAAHLVELTATFQTRFGRDYSLKPGSSSEAWTLYENVAYTQAEIARLLDAEATDSPHHRYGEWWLRRDVMDLGLTQQLLAEAGHLLACCATHDANQQPADFSYGVISSQMAIAGMLHPSSIQIGLDASVKLNAG